MRKNSPLKPNIKTVGGEATENKAPMCMLAFPTELETIVGSCNKKDAC